MYIVFVFYDPPPSPSLRHPPPPPLCPRLEPILNIGIRCTINRVINIIIIIIIVIIILHFIAYPFSECRMTATQQFERKLSDKVPPSLALKTRRERRFVVFWFIASVVFVHIFQNSIFFHVHELDLGEFCFMKQFMGARTRTHPGTHTHARNRTHTHHLSLSLSLSDFSIMYK